MSGLASGLRSGGLEERAAEPERRAGDDRGGTRGSRSRKITNSAFGDPWPTRAASTSPILRPAAPSSERGGRGRERQERGDATTDVVRRCRRDRPAATRRRGRRRPAGPRHHGGRGGHSDAPFVRRTRAMSTGAPTIAATMPASSSAGATTTRPMTSAASSTIAPSTAASGSDPPVVAADEPARGVRDGEAEQGDRARERGGGAGAARSRRGRRRSASSRAARRGRGRRRRRARAG